MYILSLISSRYHSLSELPECQLPLAQRSDVTRQALEVGTSHLFTVKTAIVSLPCVQLLHFNNCTQLGTHMDTPLYWSTEVLRVSKFRFRLVLEVLIRPSFEATLPLVSL